MVADWNCVSVAFEHLIKTVNFLPDEIDLAVF